MDDETCGRRERKKLATRQAILDAAKELFSERGFDNVTISEVAEAADVSVATVFNHVRTKEDLVFFHQPADERALAEAVRAAVPGQPLTDAVRRYEVERVTMKHDSGTLEGYRRHLGIVAGSEALQVRERWIEHRRRDELTAAVAEVLGRAGADLEVQLLAGQLVAAHRVIDGEVRRRLVAGQAPATVHRAGLEAIARVFAALDAGAGRYVRPGGGA